MPNADCQKPGGMKGIGTAVTGQLTGDLLVDGFRAYKPPGCP
jgi:hypothetical protein